MFGQKPKVTEVEPEEEKPVNLIPDTIRPGSFKQVQEETARAIAVKRAEVNAATKAQAELERQEKARLAKIRDAKIRATEVKIAIQRIKKARRQAKEAALLKHPLIRKLRRVVGVTVRPFVWLAEQVESVRFNTWLLYIYTAALLGTQLLLMYATKTGLFVNIAVLLILTACALWREESRNLSISLAVLPVTQMVNSSFKVSAGFQRACVYYSLLLLLALTYRYLFTLDFPPKKSRLKLRSYILGVLLMLVAGGLVGGVSYYFLRTNYLYQSVSLPLIIMASIIFAFAEEVFLRGLIQKQAAQLVHPLLAAGFTTLLYTVLTFNHTVVLSIVPAFVAGLVLSLVYFAKQNLLLSITVNATAKLTYVGLVVVFVTH